MQAGNLAEVALRLCLFDGRLGGHQCLVARQYIVQSQFVAAGRFLFQMGNAGFRRVIKATLVYFQFAQNQFEQAGFTRSIGAHQAYFAALVQCKGRTCKQQVGAPAQGKIGKR